MRQKSIQTDEGCAMSFNKTQKKVDKGKNIYKVSDNTRSPG